MQGAFLFSHHQNIRHFYYSTPRRSKPSTKPTEFANRFAPFRQKKKAPAQRKALRSIRKKLCHKALGKKRHPQRDEGEHQPQAAEAEQAEPEFAAGGSPCPEGPDGQQDVDRKAEQLRDRFREQAGEGVHQHQNEGDDKDICKILIITN